VIAADSPEPEKPSREGEKPGASPQAARRAAGAIVLDAGVLIGHLDGNDPHHARAASLLRQSAGQTLQASAITLAETLVAPARAGRLADAEAALRRLGVQELALGENAPSRLAQLRADVGLKLPDCCVLLAAQEHAAAVASFDSGLVAAARKLGLRTVDNGGEHW
jgi:predicted nucleic acid-binding protein